MVNGRKAAKGQIVVDMKVLYETVKREFMKRGESELYAAINGTLFLEELARDCNPSWAFAALTDIAMKALPDVERLEPSTPEEAADKAAILDAYKSNRKDEDAIRAKIQRITRRIPKVVCPPTIRVR